MKKIFRVFILSNLLFLLFPSAFYASSEPGGVDVPEFVVQEPMPGQNPAPEYIMREPEAQPDYGAIGSLSYTNKILLLNFHAAYGRPSDNIEMGVRLSYFFNTPHERIKFIGIFSPYIMRSKIYYSDTGISFTTRHYVSFSALLGIYLFGFYGVGGIDMNFKIGGRDSDNWVDDSVMYRKTCWHWMFEIGYLYLPADSRKFSFAAMIFAKMRKNGGYYDGGNKYLDSHQYGEGSVGFSISIGFNVL